MTVDALKAIYVALGGSADTVANMVIIPDVLFSASGSACRRLRWLADAGNQSALL